MMLLIWLLVSGHSARCLHTDAWAGRTVLDHATGGPVRDSQCGFRALNRRAIELLAGTLVKDDFAVESEMTRLANDQDLRFADVEINCKYGDFDTSTKNPWRHGFGNISGEDLRN